jgi:cytochrome d ubiquinol oxidase subunit I
VVAGIVITFEMGMNWGGFAAQTGPVIGPIIGMEVVTAFFVEAGFIGVLLYGDGSPEACRCRVFARITTSA